MTIDTETLSWLQSSPSGYVTAAKAIKIAWEYIQLSQKEGDFPFSPIPTAIRLYAGAPPMWMISFNYEGLRGFTVFPSGACVCVDALAGTPDFFLLE